VDKYYYLPQERDTVTGLMNKNGSLAEGYTNDAYGRGLSHAGEPETPPATAAAEHLTKRLLFSRGESLILSETNQNT
jgi:hypothetical protein